MHVVAAQARGHIGLHQRRQRGFTAMYIGGLNDGQDHLAQKIRGPIISTAMMAENLSFLFFLLLSILDLGLSTGETHVAIVDTILAEVLLTRHTLYQFIRLNFAATSTAICFHGCASLLPSSLLP